MIDTIIVAAISFLGTIVGALSGAKLTDYRIKLLEKKGDSRWKRKYM